MDDNTNLMNAEATTHEKIKVSNPQIVVSTNNPDKPCYSIIYYDVEKKIWCQGFASYCLKFVQQWFREELEVIEMDWEAVRHGRWIDEYDGKYANPRHICSSCKGKALYDFVRDELGNRKEVQVLTEHCPHCGVVMNEVK